MCIRDSNSTVLEGFSTKGGVERDGILFVMEGEKEKQVKDEICLLYTSFEGKPERHLLLYARVEGLVMSARYTRGFHWHRK